MSKDEFLPQFLPQLFTLQISARDYDTLQVALGNWNRLHNPTPLQLQEASIHTGAYLSDCYYGEYNTVSGLQQRIKRQVEPQIHGVQLAAQFREGASEATSSESSVRRGLDFAEEVNDLADGIVVG